MKPIAILYATREGQTGRIAEHLATLVRERGYSARVRDVRELREPFAMDRFGAAILAASLHMGKHEPEMRDFVKQHREALEQMPNAFLSVSLTQAGAQDAARTPEQRATATAAVQQTIDAFVQSTGWRPAMVKAVAGALLYTKYNFLVRFVMKRISKAEGGPTDTSHDYELTDWKDVERFVEGFVRQLATGRPAVAATASA